MKWLLVVLFGIIGVWSICPIILGYGKSMRKWRMFHRIGKSEDVLDE